jgi:hypothetical protein
MMQRPPAHQERKKSWGCKDFATLGCATIIVVAVLIAVVVSLNFDRIKSSNYVQSVGSMLELQAAMARQFSCDDIQVTVSMVPKEGEGRTLNVQLLNPSFLTDPEVNQEERAREAARFALNTFTLADDVGVVRIAIHSGTTGAIKITTSRKFTFTREELLDREGTAEVPAGASAE